MVVFCLAARFENDLSEWRFVIKAISHEARRQNIQRCVAATIRGKFDTTIIRKSHFSH